MRLYISSYGPGNKPEELVRLVGSNMRLAIIMNAVDLSEEYRNKISLPKQIAHLTALGFIVEEVDLRKYFGKKTDELKKVLSEFGVVWVRGGNAFVLQRAVEQSGFNKVITEMLKEDKLVYACYSAGGVVATPTLHGIEIVDNPSEIPAGYLKEFSWEGMGLIKYSFAPHYQSDHPESQKIEKVIQYYIDHNMPYKALRDGEVFIVENGQERLVS